jgi:hypothetical protein
MLGFNKKAPPAPSGPDPRDVALAETRAALEAQQARLEAERRAFMDAQNKTLQDFADLAAQVASRPNAIPQGLGGEEPMVTSDMPNEDEENMDALRRGRRGLRIDLAAPIPGAAGAGLNVPRG